MDDYILIKLNGNWIEKEQARGRISFLLEHVKNAKIMRNAVMRMSASRQMHRLGLDAFNLYVSRLANFIIDKNARIKSCYDTILKWASEDSRTKGE
jgi:hypothetical protein